MPSSRVSSPVSERILQRGGLVIDLVRHTVTLDNHLLELSNTEFALLAYLAEAAPRVVSSTELAHQVQGYSIETVEDANETLRYHIYRLRRKIKQAGGDPEYIQTVREVGYHLAEHFETNPPGGIITFLFCDVDDTNEISGHFSPEMKAALARYEAILPEIIKAHNGYIFKTVGTKFCVAFSDALNALATGISAQRALRAEKWSGMPEPRARIALYTGAAEEREGDYFGTSPDIAAMILTAAHGDQILVAQTTQQEIATHLPVEAELRDFGIRRFRGLREPQRVFQVVVPDLPSIFPVLRTLDAHASTLPAALTPFIGREAEVQALGAELRRKDVRMITLTGPGGTGKTRLGLEVASSVLDEYEDGVFFVPLATVRDPTRLISAIAQGVGVEQSPDTPPEQQLIEHLRERQMLLLLDNFEQLVDEAPIINTLLQRAPRLKVMVTSREALQIYGEHRYQVPPLPLPDLSARLTLAVLSRFAATALFIQRASASASRWRLKERDAPIIADICAKLNGLPLPIELAAARVAEFSLSELGTRLTNRLELLNAGPRDSPIRQRTLRGTLDWSFEMLSPDAQILFTRLAVFEGGFTAPAVRQVVMGPSHTNEDVVKELDSLALKSLLNRYNGESARFTMLETIREYVMERLTASGEFDILRKRHADYYCQLVRHAENGLKGNRQKTTLGELEAEHDNLRAALTWSLEVEGGETALQMSSILWRLWAVHSHLREGRAWLERTFALKPPASVELRAKALWGAGRLAMFQHDYAAAQDEFELCLTLYRELADMDGIGWALNSIGELASIRGDNVQAQQLFEEGLALHRDMDDKPGIAKALDDLGGIVLEQGDSARAAQLFEESLNRRRELGSTEGIALASFNLSKALHLQGDDKRAEELVKSSLELYRELDHATGIGICLENLGQFKEQQGNFAEAAVCYTEALTGLRGKETEETQLVADCLVGLAGAFRGLGQDYQAAQVLGTVESWLDTMKINLDALARKQYDAHRAAVHSHLGKAAWVRALSDGQTMSPGDLLKAISLP